MQGLGRVVSLGVGRGGRGSLLGRRSKPQEKGAAELGDSVR